MPPSRQVIEELNKIKNSLRDLKRDLDASAKELEAKSDKLSISLSKVDEVSRLLYSGTDPESRSTTPSSRGLESSISQRLGGLTMREKAFDEISRFDGRTSRLHSSLDRDQSPPRVISPVPGLGLKSRSSTSDILFRSPEADVIKPSPGIGNGFAEMLNAKVNRGHTEEEDSDKDSVVSVKPSFSRSGAMFRRSLGLESSRVEVESQKVSYSRDCSKTDPDDDLLRPQPSHLAFRSERIPEMPKENEKGCRRDAVEISELQHTFLLDPVAKGQERISIESGAAIKIRVNKGRTGVMVYGIPTAIEAAKQLLSSVKREVFSLDSTSSAANLGEGGVRARANMIAEKAGVVIQVNTSVEGIRTMEMVGLPLGIENALSIIDDSGLF